MISYRLTAVVAAMMLLVHISRASAIMFAEGEFRVQEAHPWRIEVLSGMHGPTELGLPTVTPDDWRCKGRKPTAQDVGKKFQFLGVIPDMGGRYYIEASDDDLKFVSKYSEPHPCVAEIIEKVKPGLKRLVLIAATVGTLIIYRFSINVSRRNHSVCDGT